MKKRYTSGKRCLLAGVVGGASLFAMADDADAAVVRYESPRHVFSMNDVIGGFDGRTYAEDRSIICTSGCPAVETKEGATLYPIDSEFAFESEDFTGAVQKVRDGSYREGWAGSVTENPGIDGLVPNSDGVYGIVVSTPDTGYFKTKNRWGTWCTGIGGLAVKCSSEQYAVMEHILTCRETVPYFYPFPIPAYCQGLDDSLVLQTTGLEISRDAIELGVDLDPNESDLINVAVGANYAVTLKDDGKPLYRWGNLVKRPTDVRLYANLPLPEQWGAVGSPAYRVIKAKLIIRHLVTNNPNEQVRPEDLENEAATGRLPEYRIDADGRWFSTVPCFEGDGDAIAENALFRDPARAVAGGLSADLRGGVSNAWYTTIQRDPFESDPLRNPDGTYALPRDAAGNIVYPLDSDGHVDFDQVRSGPRWRLKSKMFGQNIPGLEIPKLECAEPPYKKGEEQVRYPVGTPTETVINLLDWANGALSPLATSQGWMGINYAVGDHPGVSINGVKLTDGFDLAVYVKGEQKSTTIYDVRLVLEYDDEPIAPAGGE